MKTLHTIIALTLAAGLLMPTTAARAHGGPQIVLAAEVAAAGDVVTISGSDMEAGEIFVISLEGAVYSAVLGQVEVREIDGEGGFEVSLAIPAEAPPGSYLVRAATEEGETATAEISVTASAVQAAAPAEREASAEPLQVERPRSSGQLAVVVLSIALASGAGLWLARRDE